MGGLVSEEGVEQFQQQKNDPHYFTRKGFLEDRRPSSNCDPYQVFFLLERSERFFFWKYVKFFKIWSAWILLTLTFLNFFFFFRWPRCWLKPAVWTNEHFLLLHLSNLLVSQDFPFWHIIPNFGIPAPQGVGLDKFSEAILNFYSIQKKKYCSFWVFDPKQTSSPNFNIDTSIFPLLLLHSIWIHA